MKCPQISIIVPVYNVAPFLDKCVASILSQSFKDFEVLLINDGSKDESGTLCEEYAKKDTRVKVYHKENGGVSSARNYGISKSLGTWLFFSDADDELMPDCLDFLIGCTLKGSYDIIMGGNIREDKDGNIIDTIPPEISYEISNAEALWLMYEKKYFYSETYLWDKLFRKDAILSTNTLFNPEIPIKEDCLFIVQLLCRTKTPVYYSTHIVYKYKRNDNSVMTRLRSTFSPKQVSIFKAHMLQIKAIYESKQSKKLYFRAIYGAYISICDLKNMMKKSHCYDRFFIKSLKSNLKMQVGNAAYRISFLIHYVYKIKKIINYLIKQ